MKTRVTLLTFGLWLGGSVVCFAAQAKNDYLGIWVMTKTEASITGAVGGAGGGIALTTSEAPRPGADDPHASDYGALKLFMQNHKWIADQLKEDPSRATSKSFLNKGKELREFLEAHPFLQDQFKQDARRTLDQALQPGGEFL